MRKQIVTALLRILGVLALIVAAVWIIVAQPSFKLGPRLDLTVDHTRMESAVRTLSVDLHPRNHGNLMNLDASASFIRDHFSKTTGTVSDHDFEVAGKEYRNISCLFDSPSEKRIVIGAHYDSHSHTPGADDNASGVAGLIELAHLLNTQSMAVDVELVAYTLEEPPFFGTNQMGSYKHAE